MDRCQQGPIRSVLLVVIGWLVGLLVGNAVFSETVLRTFLIFCMKLRDYKDRKVTEPDFWKKFLTWRLYSWKGVQISPKSGTLKFFSKTATKYGLQFEWNLFFRKFAIWRYLSLKSSKKLPKLSFLAIFSTLHH